MSAVFPFFIAGQPSKSPLRAASGKATIANASAPMAASKLGGQEKSCRS